MNPPGRPPGTRCTLGTMSGRRYLLRTFGCQMNEHDSERIAGLLTADGYVPTEEAGDASVGAPPTGSHDILQVCDRPLTAVACRFRHGQRIGLESDTHSPCDIAP